MKQSTSGEITHLLEAIGSGDRAAADRLFPLIYAELRQLAHARMSGEAPQTLQPTALVHEVYLRLMGQERPVWENRGHFFTAAAEAMRRVLIEQARRRGRLKRGGDRQRVELESAMRSEQARAEELLELNEALDRLEKLDPQMAGVVKLRFFAGLTVEETAKAIGSSPRTVNRQWTRARAWLQREIDTN